MTHPGPDLPDVPSSDRFSPTRWTLVQQSSGTDESAREALAELCQEYYAPVVAFLRRDGRPEDDARDLAHGFFARVLEDGGFGDADRSRGSFRSYLLGALKHHLQHERRKLGATKRGGGIEHVPLGAPGGGGPGPEVAGPGSPGVESERAFDRQWAVTLLERAMSALETEFARMGKSAHFEHLRRWLTSQGAAGDQAEAAARLGMSVNALRVAIHRIRQRFATLVREEIAHTVAGGEAEVTEELRHLLAVIGTP